MKSNEPIVPVNGSPAGKARNVLLAICLVALVAGFSGIGNPMFIGLAKAVGAVFFILFYIASIAKAAGDPT
ncbi:MAG: hypothetical protein AB1813_08570 [Verrucomicrobiota bacterium]